MAFDNAHLMTGGGVAANDGTHSFDVFVPEVWGPAVELAFKNQLVFGKLAKDLSSFAAGGGDVIHIPTFDTISSGTKTPETAISYGVDGAAQTEETLTINQHAYSATLIEDLLKVQSSYDLMNIYTGEMGYSLGNTIDNKIEDLLLASCQSASGKINGIVTGADLKGSSNSDFELILSNVLGQDPDVTNWTLVVSPAAYATLSALVQLSYGTAGSPLGQGFANSGQIGTVFGMPIMMSNNVTTAQTNMDNAGGQTDNFTPIGYCVHKSAIQIAYSQKVRMQADYDIDHLGTKMVSDVIYGVNVRNSSTTGQRRVFILGAE
jgi:hypothetical protein